MRPRLGVRVHREQPPETVVAYAQNVERLGFDDVWVVEDLAFGGGPTTAAAVLAATTRIEVGIGILAAVVRNPVYAAMEIATLERMAPGRLITGIGHGVQSWMAAVGAGLDSPLTALRETVTVVGDLLAGRRVSFEGRYVRVDDVALTFPPTAAPSILAGVRGPKSLAMAGSACDGVLLAEPATPAYVSWARQLVAGAAASAGRPRPEVAVYAWLSVDDDPEQARRRLRPALAENLADRDARIHLSGLPFGEQLSARMDAPDRAQRENALELDWVAQLGIVGTPDECAQAVRELASSGADRVILLPIPGDEHRQLDRFARDVLPLLAGRSGR